MSASDLIISKTTCQGINNPGGQDWYGECLWYVWSFSALYRTERHAPTMDNSVVSRDGADMYSLCHHRYFYNGSGTFRLMICFSFVFFWSLAYIYDSSFFHIVLVPGASGCQSWTRLEGKLEGWTMVIPNLFYCYHDSHLLDFAGPGGHCLWPSSLLSSL